MNASQLAAAAFLMAAGSAHGQWADAAHVGMWTGRGKSGMMADP